MEWDCDGLCDAVAPLDQLRQTTGNVRSAQKLFDVFGPPVPAGPGILFHGFDTPGDSLDGPLGPSISATEGSDQV